MLSHLLEIRRRVIIILVTFVGFFSLFFLFANQWFQLIISPLTLALSFNDSLIATHITSLVLAPISLAADSAIFCTLPVILFHVWRFVRPALYVFERQKMRLIIVASLLLFCLGVAFCFYFILPVMFHFFAKSRPLGVKLTPDIEYAQAFIIRMLLLFGLCFEIPLFILISAHLHWIDSASLRQIRPYIIVLAFVVGMLLTPPDVLSQLMLAVPLCILYEIGILLVACLQKNQN